MPYTITREDASEDLRVLRAAIQVASGFVDEEADAMVRLRALADAIEEQVKPAVEEPTEFGSLVRAGRGGSDRVLWHPTTFHGKHYWMSETGVVEVWSELTDVEVLRVGLGEDSEAFNDGMREMNAAIHQKVRSLLAEAITGERKNAFEKAIQAVEELAP